jgi:serine protease Do
MPATVEEIVFSAKIKESTAMSDNQLIEQIERYLNGDMAKAERAGFETLRAENPDVNSKVTEHKHFTNLIKQYGERLELEQRLNAIHDEIDVHTLKEELMIHPSGIVRLWRNHHSKISVAASIAIFAVICTLNYVKLKGDIEKLKHSNAQIASTLNGIKTSSANPGKYRGTGFAITSNGYIITDYHVVNNADSVSVQNADGKSFSAKVIYTEPATDIAILQITDPSFKTLGAIPYTFKKPESDIGENVFTIGYPRETMVLGAGYLTAGSGFSGDSTAYQVSIPVNFGNSGGPLVDNKGNIIGIVNAKQTNVQGAAFAVKSGYLLKAIQDIPVDSLKKPLNLNTRNVLSNLSRVQQIKKMQNYVFMVRVYNQ